MSVPERRNTAYYAGRTSIFLTAETRGAPYKWISVFIAGTYIFFGLRNVFFCGAKLPVGKGEDIIMDMWSDCQEDRVKTIFGGLHGLGDWMVGKCILTSSKQYPYSVFSRSLTHCLLLDRSGNSLFDGNDRIYRRSLFHHDGFGFVLYGLSLLLVYGLESPMYLGTIWPT